MLNPDRRHPLPQRSITFQEWHRLNQVLQHTTTQRHSRAMTPTLTDHVIAGSALPSIRMNSYGQRMPMATPYGQLVLSTIL